MSEDTSMKTHLKQMKNIPDKLAAIRALVYEKNQIVTLLGSLPDSYSTMVTALQARGECLTFEIVQNALLNEERKRGIQRALDKTAVSNNVKHSASCDTALSADREYHKLECYNCHSTQHLIRDCRKLRPSYGRRVIES